jgi:hypothetical protein
VTIAYSSAGVPLWTNLYSGSATSVAVDGSGNSFVTGFSYSRRGGNEYYVTIAYSSAGVPLWTNLYSGSATSVAVDGSGNVFVTGSSADSGGDTDFTTIAYSGAGVPLWTNYYGGRGDAWDSASAMAVDGRGNVVVTGTSGTIAYSRVGLPLWTNLYSGSATAMAMAASGNVFVTGISAGFHGLDYATIAYSAGGVPLWTNLYNGAVNGDDTPTAVAVDGRGTVFVTGYSAGLQGYDYATIAYSAGSKRCRDERIGRRGFLIQTGRCHHHMAILGVGAGSWGHFAGLQRVLTAYADATVGIGPVFGFFCFVSS